MAKRLLDIASEIVQAQVGSAGLSTDEVVSSLKQIFNALQEMQKSETEGAAVQVPPTQPLEREAPEGEKSPTKLSPQDSIRNDKIVCLECGAEMRQITAKHLASHDLDPKGYKKKYGFPLGQSLSAKDLSRARSKAAKKRGLPENLRKLQEERRQKAREGR